MWSGQERQEARRRREEVGRPERATQRLANVTGRDGGRSVPGGPEVGPPAAHFPFRPNAPRVTHPARRSASGGGSRGRSAARHGSRQDQTPPACQADGSRTKTSARPPSIHPRSPPCPRSPLDRSWRTRSHRGRSQRRWRTARGSRRPRTRRVRSRSPPSVSRRRDVVGRPRRTRGPEPHSRTRGSVHRRPLVPRPVPGCVAATVEPRRRRIEPQACDQRRWRSRSAACGAWHDEPSAEENASECEIRPARRAAEHRYDRLRPPEPFCPSAVRERASWRPRQAQSVVRRGADPGAVVRATKPPRVASQWASSLVAHAHRSGGQPDVAGRAS